MLDEEVVLARADDPELDHVEHAREMCADAVPFDGGVVGVGWDKVALWHLVVGGHLYGSG